MTTKESGTPTILRQINLSLIRDLIIQNGPITKVEIARLSGASVPTVNKIVNQLEEDGLICRTEIPDSKPGRKAAYYIGNKDSAFFIAFFIQNGKVLARLVNSLGEALQEVKLNPDTNSKSAMEAALFETIEHFQNVIPGKRVSAIGLGIPGVIGQDGLITSIPTVPCWEGKDLRGLIHARYGIPVFIENDVKLMTVGVYHRELADCCENMVFMYIYRGVGAGIILKGQLYKGFSNFAGEFGFMSVFSHESPQALEAELCAMSEKAARGETLNTEEKQRRDALIAAAIINFITVLNPEVVALHSGILDAEAIQGIREILRRNISADCLPQLRLIPENTCGIEGAADLCMAGTTSKISLVSQTGL